MVRRIHFYNLFVSLMKKKIAVIGAGIIGVSTAIWLQRDGHKVVLIDREGPAAGASYGNGGVLVPSGIIPVNAPGLISSAPGMLMRSDSPLFVHWPYLPKMLPWLMRYLSRANATDARQTARALSYHQTPSQLFLLKINE